MNSDIAPQSNAATSREEPVVYWHQKALEMEAKASQKWNLLAVRISFFAFCTFGSIGTALGIATFNTTLFLAALPCLSISFPLAVGWVAAKVGIEWAKMMMEDLDFYIFPEKIAAQCAALVLQCAEKDSIALFKEVQHLCPQIDSYQHLIQLCVDTGDTELFKHIQHLESIDLAKFFDYGYRDYDSFLANGYEDSRFGKLNARARAAINQVIQERQYRNFGLCSTHEIMNFVYEHEELLESLEDNKNNLFLSPEEKFKNFVEDESFEYDYYNKSRALISKEIILKLVEAIGDQCKRLVIPDTIKDKEIIIALEQKGFRRPGNMPWCFVRKTPKRKSWVRFELNHLMFQFKNFFSPAKPLQG